MDSKIGNSQKGDERILHHYLPYENESWKLKTNEDLRLAIKIFLGGVVNRNNLKHNFDGIVLKIILQNTCSST